MSHRLSKRDHRSPGKRQKVDPITAVILGAAGLLFGAMLGFLVYVFLLGFSSRVLRRYELHRAAETSTALPLAIIAVSAVVTAVVFALRARPPRNPPPPFS